MRIWFSGPRILGGLIRPGVSFGPEDLRAIRRRQAGQSAYALPLVVRMVLGAVLGVVFAVILYVCGVVFMAVLHG